MLTWLTLHKRLFTLLSQKSFIYLKLITNWNIASISASMKWNSTVPYQNDMYCTVHCQKSFMLQNLSPLCFLNITDFFNKKLSWSQSWVDFNDSIFIVRNKIVSIFAKEKLKFLYNFLLFKNYMLIYINILLMFNLLLLLTRWAKSKIFFRWKKNI